MLFRRSKSPGLLISSGELSAAAIRAGVNVVLLYDGCFINSDGLVHWGIRGHHFVGGLLRPARGSIADDSFLRGASALYTEITQ